MAKTKTIKIVLQDRGVPEGLKKISDRLSGVKDGQDSLRDSMEKSLRVTGSYVFQLERLARAMQQVRGQMGGRSSIGAGSGGGGGGSANRQPKLPSTFGDPQAVISSYSQAAWNGDPYAVKMVNRAQTQIKAHQRAQKVINPYAFQKTPAQQYMSAMMRTRFMMGPGGKMVAMPLGADIAKFGTGMMGGGLGDAMGGASTMVQSLSAVTGGASAASAAFAVLAGSAMSLKARFDSLMSTQATGGGSMADSSIVNRLESRFPGLKDWGRGTMDGIQAAEAQAAGINPVGGPYGDTNYSQKQIDAVRYIANQPTYEDARRKAEALGLPAEVANAQRLSAEQKRKLFQPNNSDASYDPSKLVQNEEQRRKYGEGVQRAWETIGNIGVGVVDAWVNWGNRTEPNAFDKLFPPGPSGFGGTIPNGMDKVKQEKSQSEKTLEQIEKNTAKTAEAVQYWMQGNYGGDSRIDSFPDRLPKYAIDEAAMEEIRLSAI